MNWQFSQNIYSMRIIRIYFVYLLASLWCFLLFVKEMFFFIDHVPDWMWFFILQSSVIWPSITIVIKAYYECCVLLPHTIFCNLYYGVKIIHAEDLVELDNEVQRYFMKQYARNKGNLSSFTNTFAICFELMTKSYCHVKISQSRICLDFKISRTG